MTASDNNPANRPTDQALRGDLQDSGARFPRPLAIASHAVAFPRFVPRARGLRHGR